MLLHSNYQLKEERSPACLSPYLQALAETSVRIRASKLPFKFEDGLALGPDKVLPHRTGTGCPPQMEGSVVWLSENALKSRRFSFTPRCLGKGASGPPRPPSASRVWVRSIFPWSFLREGGSFPSVPNNRLRAIITEINLCISP